MKNFIDSLKGNKRAFNYFLDKVEHAGISRKRNASEVSKTYYDKYIDLKS